MSSNKKIDREKLLKEIETTIDEIEGNNAAWLVRLSEWGEDPVRRVDILTAMIAELEAARDSSW